MKSYLGRIKSKGKCPPRIPFKKILWSWVGAFIGIYAITLSSKLLTENLFLIGSFGASAVLIYGAPLADFSQPRNLIGGHCVSALVGVSVFQLLGNNLSIASALAVSLAVVMMHLTRTIHPPGGATSLIAVLGGQKTQELGFFMSFHQYS